jgi:Ni,Fe-hydrogenase III large subunit
LGGVIKNIKEIGNLTVTNIIENFRNSFEKLEDNFNQTANFYLKKIQFTNINRKINWFTNLKLMMSLK